MSFDRQAWLEERRQGIGGSDLPVILGLSPFSTPHELWLDKRGLLPDPEPSAPILRGAALEDLVADMYAAVTGRVLTKPENSIVHPNYPFLRANPDRFFDDGAGVLEIKCPGLGAFAKCKREGLLDYYYAQLQHYLCVTGTEVGSMAIFNAERWELLHFDVTYDAEFMSMAIPRAEAFWNLVQSGEEPPEGKPEDVPQIESPDKPEPMSATVSGLVEAFATYKEIADEAKAAEDAAKEALKEALGDSILVESKDWRIQRSVRAGRKTFDPKKLAKDHPKIDLNPYYKLGAAYEVLLVRRLGRRVED